MTQPAPDPRTLAQGRAAHDRHAWGEAYERLGAAAEQGALETEDLERLATAAYLTGHGEAAMRTLTRLHHALVQEGDISRAARWGVWLAILLALRGNHAQSAGWSSRSERLLTRSSPDCAERGYVLVPSAFQALGSGDARRAYALFQQVAAIAARFDEVDLQVIGMLGVGQALVAMGQTERGVEMLDEAMVAVTAGDTSPVMAGIAYCAVIVTCRAVFDVRRAREWTAALSRWCSDQEDLRPYRGQCLVHRSEIMQLRGDWTQALEEVERACDLLAETPGDPVIGMASYQQADLLRLRGDLVRAERCYRVASEHGHPVQPGLALLRLAQGRTTDAVAAVRREARDAEADRVRRSHVLAAGVQILLAAGDLDGARAAADDLQNIAADIDSVYLDACAARARGAVLLAEGDAIEACVVLRRAWRSWQELDAPYDAACVRMLMAQSFRLLGDHDTADMELDAACRVFEQLGAAPALADALAGSRGRAADIPGGLTPRETEVLRVVATGASNREIADTLVISEKTVARHLNNLFTKLGVTSRAAATAWAYEHHLA